jgi:trehalose 6-phosphate synthase/phosphatase
MARLIVVSNRLPDALQATDTDVALSRGGLVRALELYVDARKRDDRSFECIWLGSTGNDVADGDPPELRSTMQGTFRGAAVRLPSEEEHDFYRGFCHDTLWPLFHYFPSYAAYNPAHFSAYQRVNERFRDALAQALAPGDAVWIHDYQLMLLPRLVRELGRGTPIGFFLHVPFPCYELFRLLPASWKQQLLAGMLGADLIGFQTSDYTQYFLDCVLRTLGKEHQFGQISVDEQARRADTFPIGVDFERFMSAATHPDIVQQHAQIEASVRKRQIVLSVGRLDYTTGMVDRLLGFQEFLRRCPHWQGKVVLMLVVMPARIVTPQNERMKLELDELVARINGELGKLDWVPVSYLYRSLSFEALVALYSLASVALSTPLRGGMNLAAKEYLAARPDGTGVLILSEMAGAAQELGESLLVNPKDHGEIARALEQALTMSPGEQVRRNRAMQKRLNAQNAQHWAARFLGSLMQAKSEPLVDGDRR